MQTGLGCARLGSAAGGTGRRSSTRLVHAAVDLGVAYFDTADAYGAGASERLLGEALGGRRQHVQIATKGGYLFRERSTVARALRGAAKEIGGRVRAARPGSAPAAGRSAYADQDFSVVHLTAALEASLRRLRTDHVDVYQLHGPRAGDPEAIAGWAETMVAVGKIGRFGIGAEDLIQAIEWLHYPAVESVQVPFGVLDPEAGDDLIPRAHAAGKAVVVRGVLGAGLLAAPHLAGSDNAHKLPLIEGLRALASERGMTTTSLAIDFVRARTDVDTVLVGTRTPAHLVEVVDAMNAPAPDPTLLASIDAAIAAHRGRT